jgi:hypothetical protein
MTRLDGKSIGRFQGAALATAAAGLFLLGTGAVAAAEKTEAKVQCEGVNACKGKSACATPKSSCKGRNACKGQGWISMPEAECTAKGGKAMKG